VTSATKFNKLKMNKATALQMSVTEYLNASNMNHHKNHAAIIQVLGKMWRKFVICHYIGWIEAHCLLQPILRKSKYPQTHYSAQEFF
jgi:hypothetical protein